MHKYFIFLCLGVFIFGFDTTSYAMDVDLDETRLGVKLMDAAYLGDIKKVEALLDQGVPIDVKTSSGFTPLMTAAIQGQEKVCKLLIAKKASIDAKDFSGRTPLVWAALNNHDRICKLVIDAMLTPIKQNQSAIIALLGIKKFRNVDYLRLIGREIIQLIARPAYMHSKQKLVEHINSIQPLPRDQSDRAIMMKVAHEKKLLLNYAKKQLNLRVL